MTREVIVDEQLAACAARWLVSDQCSSRVEIAALIPFTRIDDGEYLSVNGSAALPKPIIQISSVPLRSVKAYPDANLIPQV